MSEWKKLKILSKFKCGRCFRGFDELHAFGDHVCPGENPFLAAFGGVIRLGEYSVDLVQCVEESAQQQKIKRAIENLEDGMRRTDL
jgi:hypothetical protein